MAGRPVVWMGQEEEICVFKAPRHLGPLGKRRDGYSTKGEGEVRLAGEWAANPARWAEEKLGFELEPAQRELLETGGNRVILNCSRQWGKSSVAAAKALHTAWFRDESLVVVVSPSERQSWEFVLKAAKFLPGLGAPVRGDGNHRASLVLPNGSRIIGLPGTEGTIRGYSAASLVVVDEAALVKDEQYRAAMPMLAVTDGDLWVMSTPRGKKGFFWEIWANGGEDWKRVSVTAERCPRISEEFLRKQRVEMGADWVRQEYMCEFVDLSDSLFDRDVLMEAVKETVKKLW